jgi:hypothetical protein
MSDAAAAAAVDDALEVVVRPAMPAAPPEQGQMAGRSIEALVADSDSGRQHFDLRVTDRTIFAAEVAHGIL